MDSPLWQFSARNCAKNTKSALAMSKNMAKMGFFPYKTKNFQFALPHLKKLRKIGKILCGRTFVCPWHLETLLYCTLLSSALYTPLHCTVLWTVLWTVLCTIPCTALHLSDLYRCSQGADRGGQPQGGGWEGEHLHTAALNQLLTLYHWHW